MVEGRAAERTGDTGRIVLLTGLSGAGKTTALKAFEDVGFEVVDNIPFSLLDQLLADDTAMRLAIGLDVRTRGFTVDRLLALKRRLEGRPGIDVSLVFLDCDDEAALRRFTETRRRHPLTGAGTAREGLSQERALLAPLRGEADRVLDTSLMTPRELKRWVAGGFEAAGPKGMTVQVVSFSFRQGLPRGRQPYLQRSGHPVIDGHPRMVSGVRVAALRARGQELSDAGHRMHRRPPPLRLHRRAIGRAIAAARMDRQCRPPRVGNFPPRNSLTVA